MVKIPQRIKWKYFCLGIVAILLMWNLMNLLDYQNIFSTKLFAPSATVDPSMRAYIHSENELQNTDHVKLRYVSMIEQKNNDGINAVIDKSQENDYIKLIDLENFYFRILELICYESNVLLLILIHSAPKHFNNRKIIRETWGLRNHEVKTLFLLGSIKDDTMGLQEKLEEESLLHKDLVQGNFIDSYRNLTYKHVMALKYSIYHCPHAQFVLRTDDDIFVNVLSLVEFLRRQLCPFRAANLILCRINYGLPVLRNGKWGVTLEEFPNETYPTCCSGYMVLYSQDVIRKLYTEAQKVPYFWIEDVHVTGTLAQKADIIHTDSEALTISFRNKKKVLNGLDIGDSTNMLFGPVNSNEKDIRALWEYVQNH